MIAWKPIETAPKDGSVILIFDPRYAADDGVVEGYWSESRHQWTGPWDEQTWVSYEPTHWSERNAPEATK